MNNNSIYLITDPSLPFDELLKRVEACLAHGLWAVQYRNKTASSRLMYEEATELNNLCQHYNTPFLINDRVDLALAVKASGVHLGASDLPVAVARELLGPNAIIGATSKTTQQALTAEKDGANYLGVGALFASTTKPDAIGINLATLQAIREVSSLNVFGIGGITENNLTPEITKELNGVAVCSLLLHSANYVSSMKALTENFS